MRANMLSALPPAMSNLSKLRDLAISFNTFANIPACVYALSKLNTLVASDNRITTIDAAQLLLLTSLVCLDLSNNSIDAVPNELGRMDRLTTLKLEGNTFKVPRMVRTGVLMRLPCHHTDPHRPCCSRAPRPYLPTSRPALDLPRCHVYRALLPFAF